MTKEKYNWDLESLLGNKSLEDLFKQWYQTELKLVALVNSFYKTKANFKKWLSLTKETEAIGNRLLMYVMNHNAEELDNPQWIAWQQKIVHVGNELALKTSNWTNLVLENEAKIKSYLKDSDIKDWTREFDLIFKERKHILSKKAELLMTKVSPATTGVNDIFTTLTDSDLKFDDAIDAKGKPHKILTISDAIQLLKEPKDRTLRRNAWISYNKAFNSVKNTLTKTLYYNYLRANKLAQIRNYKNYIDAALENEEVNEKILLAAYKHVASFKSAYNEYRKHRLNLIKKIHHITELEPWDLSLDLSAKKIKVTIEQAKQEVVKALAPLGTNYLKVVNKAFKENWISWLPKAHKTTGAYSIDNTYGLNKYYILMNFDNSSDAVSTIAHEMGHSVCSYYLNHAQTIYTSTDMFVGEVPSILNEMLLNFYWLKKYQNNKTMKLHVLENMLSTFFGCTTRQILFSKFEWEANKLINEGKPFTVSDVERLYLEARKTYEGVSKKALAKINKYPYCLANTGILRIPHFYMNNFYVYKYAIGQVIALVIANEIYNGNKTMLNNYFKFLKAGTSLPPLEIIKLTGIDLNKGDVYQQALMIVNKLIKEFKQIKK
ncbi:MAG: oligoendopeptidase F [Mycoplasma sp.]|nr:oligoendopeptidase F [Candidatus Hennigella equi]